MSWGSLVGVVPVSYPLSSLVFQQHAASSTISSVQLAAYATPRLSQGRAVVSGKYARECRGEWEVGDGKSPMEIGEVPELNSSGLQPPGIDCLLLLVQLGRDRQGDRVGKKF